MRFPVRPLMFALLALLAVIALPPQLEAQRKDQNRITQEEIQVSGAQNALDLARTARPNWFRTRGPTTLGTTRLTGQALTDPMTNPNSPGPSQTVASEGNIIVYLDGVRMGSQNALREITPADVVLIEFLDHRRALARFGSAHPNGAILVSTSRASQTNQ